MELLKNVIVSLKAKGIRIALDDFGTGFSSVGLLREIPLDTIKIDRSFVQHIEESETDCQLVENVVELGTIFGSKVCVEGIETAGMRDILRQFRAKSFQGYFYAKPLPLPEAEQTGSQGPGVPGDSGLESQVPEWQSVCSWPVQRGQGYETGSV